jgi:hypothetical protein
MQKNEGSLDRWIRAILGVLIIYSAYQIFSGIGQIIGFIIGAVLIVTSITGFCYLYKLLGISTKK